MATDREAQLLKAAYEAGFTSPKELANFMAQVGAESGGLSRLNEGFVYTKGPDAVSDNVKSALREGPEALKTAWQDAMNGKPEQLAELMYGGRMGNTEPGDGYKYHGRGYIQLTGKDQYKAAGDALGMDLVNKPELAADPENASKIAVWYWKENVQALAAENVKEAGSIINTGEKGNMPNGLKHRETEFSKWERALTPEVMEKLSKGEVGLPITSEKSSHARPQHDAAADGVLKQGEKGPAIKETQIELAKLGYVGADGKPLAPDSDFGKNMKRAVENFQRAHDLNPVDGIVGKNTLAALEQAKKAPLVSEATHPDNKLFQALKDKMPDIDDAHVGKTLQATKEAGITGVDSLRDVTVLDGNAFVTGTTPGFRAKVDLNQPAPSLQETTAQISPPSQDQTQAQTQAQQPQGPAR